MEKISSMPMVNHAGITFALCIHKRHDNQLNGSPGWRQNKMREIVKEKFMQKSLHFGLNLYFMNLNLMIFFSRNTVFSDLFH